MRLKKKFYIFTFLLAFLLIGCGGYYFYNQNNNQQQKTSQDISPDKYFKLKRGNLIIGIRQAGFINSKKKHKLAFEPHISTKLLWIIDENSKVKSGDILAKFEAESLNETIDDLKINIDNLEKELAIALEEKKILVSTNKSSIKEAMDKVTEASDSFRKYRKFERKKQRDSLTLAVSTAESNYEDAQENYEDKVQEIEEESSTDADTLEENEDELEELLQKRDDAKNTWKNSQLDLKVFKRYTHPNKMTTLQNSLDQAKLQLNKVKIQTASQVLQKRKSINNLQIRLRKYKEKLKKYLGYIEKMQLYSPVDGVVIYGDPDRRWGNPEIKLGMDIRRKQVLLTIPDMSELIVEFDLPEQYRSKVRLNDKVVVSPESLPGVRVNGRLSKISQLPVNQIHWDRNSPKIYKSQVALNRQNKRLVSGMSVQLEVITEILRNTLFIPIESVREEGGKFFVYKRSGFKAIRQSITIGKANDNFVQVLSGLQEGDIVYLYKPFQKKSE